jgi:hypothetical protein
MYSLLQYCSNPSCLSSKVRLTKLSVVDPNACRSPARTGDTRARSKQRPHTILKGGIQCKAQNNSVSFPEALLSIIPRRRDPLRLSVTTTYI